MELTRVTRVTVVSREGRVLDLYNEYSNGVEIYLQDDGRTLKIFPRKEQEEN